MYQLEGKELVVFGTGQMAKRFTEDFPGQYSFFVDNNAAKWGGTFCEKPVYAPSQLTKSKHFVVVASMYYVEISNQLQSMGFISGTDFVDAEEHTMQMKLKKIKHSVIELVQFDTTSDGEKNDLVEHAFTSIFSEYDRIHQYTNGFLTKLDVAALIYIGLFQGAINKGTEVKALEIGSWTGFSSYFLAKALNMDTQGQLYCVDSWGSFSAYAPKEEYTQFVDVMHIFRGLMRGLGVIDKIRVLNMLSNDAWGILGDNQFDLIFIDGDHTYQYVLTDGFNALKKAKFGGIIIGHDYHHHDMECPPADWLLNNKDNRIATFQGKDYFPGVNLAVNELFGGSKILIPHSSVWGVRKLHHL